MTTRKIFTICAAISVVAAIFHPAALSWWFSFAIEGKSFTSDSLSTMAEWPFEFTWFLIVGLAIGIAIQSHRPSLWGIACGAFGSLVNFGFTTHIFYPQTPWIVVFLEYAAYSVPLFAGALGASIGAMFKRKAAPS